jgi:hypothetical protein
MLVGMMHRQVRRDLILFADTGGEKPETYAYRETFGEWLARVGFPPVITVQNDGKHASLEAECLTQKVLPSLAYGWKKCSEKYKKRPQDKFVKTWQPAIDAIAAGKKMTKAIGFDAGERRRERQFPEEKYHYWYPLIEWGWWREECVEAIVKEGLKVPPKSSCFFCPASTKREIFRLADEHPDLIERAFAMERNAAENLETVKGLGRRFSWEEAVRVGRDLPLFSRGELDNPGSDIPCMCFDGEE